MQLICGDSLKVVSSWKPNSIDGLLTDPPYGLEFMGKDWDKGLPGVRFWREFLRITKPGGFLLCFGGTRTYHRLACAIEDAGWEIRDCMMWLYGSGFPKSHNISKAIDKAAGAKRKVIGTRPVPGYARSEVEHGKQNRNKFEFEQTSDEPATPFAETWQGYGTALKPAWEPIIVAMKPLDGTFAHNAEAHGVAGLNITAARIGTDEVLSAEYGQPSGSGCYSWNKEKKRLPRTGKVNTQGRWPANLILDEEAGALLDEQTGQLSQCGGEKKTTHKNGMFGIGTPGRIYREQNRGGSRFFKQIEITIGDLIWNGTFVDYVEKLLWIIEATIENIVPSNVWDWHKELKDLNAGFVEKKLGLCEIYTALVLAGIKNLGSSQEALQAIQDSIGNCNRCTQILNLVMSVENLESIDIIQTTTNLLKSCGYVRPVIKKCTQKTNQSEPNRFIYVPKTSRKERNIGMEDQKNSHPTVKPLALMKYLCTLLKMPSAGQIILDPFMGSGTTGMACASLGIGFIGIEKESEYCEISSKRIAAISGEPLLVMKPSPYNSPPKNLPRISEHRQSIINAASAELRRKRN